MLIDSHCHLTAEDLAADVSGVLQRATQADVRRVVNIATTAEDALHAFELLGGFPQISFALGVVPHEAGCPDEHVDRFEAVLREALRDATLGPRVVALGEIGLDFHYDFAPRDRQEAVFRRQLALAAELELPVVLHARNAEQRVCDILAEHGGFEGRAVFHCFSAGPDDARRVLDDGFWISLTGMVTFKNAGAVREVGRLIPDDRVMIETDAPYLSPAPRRNQRPNEPALLVHTNRFMAELRGATYDEFAALTTRNAERFFHLPEVFS